jgi:hypothetical protein
VRSLPVVLHYHLARHAHPLTSGAILASACPSPRDEITPRKNNVKVEFLKHLVSLCVLTRNPLCFTIAPEPNAWPMHMYTPCFQASSDFDARGGARNLLQSMRSMHAFQTKRLSSTGLLIAVVELDGFLFVLRQHSISHQSPKAYLYREAGLKMCT